MPWAVRELYDGWNGAFFFFYKKQGGYIEKNSFTPFSYDLEANE